MKRSAYTGCQLKKMTRAGQTLPFNQKRSPSAEFLSNFIHMNALFIYIENKSFAFYPVFTEYISHLSPKSLIHIKQIARCKPNIR